MVPYYIFRQHVLPVDVNGVEDIVMKRYKKYFKKYDVLMTSYEMNVYIRKRWKRNDIWEERTICIRVPSKRHQTNAIQSESFNQYWIDKKPVEGDFCVFGDSTDIDVECVICKYKGGTKIQLDQCKCVFHKKCIEQAVKYSNTCPVCKCTINKILHVHNTNAA